VVAALVRETRPRAPESLHLHVNVAVEVRAGRIAHDAGGAARPRRRPASMRRSTPGSGEPARLRLPHGPTMRAEKSSLMFMVGSVRCLMGCHGEPDTTSIEQTCWSSAQIPLFLATAAGVAIAIARIWRMTRRLVIIWRRCRRMSARDAGAAHEVRRRAEIVAFERRP